MFELFMYVYSYCNALSARFFAVDRALNAYFMIMIECESHANAVEDLHGVVALRVLVLDEHDASERAHAERLDALKVLYRRSVLYAQQQTNTCHLRRSLRHQYVART